MQENEERSDGALTLGEKAEALSEKQWKLYNIIGGAVLGLCCGAALFWLGQTPEFENFSLLIAAALAILVPRYFQTRIQRSLQTGRLTLIAVFALCLLVALARSLGWI